MSRRYYSVLNASKIIGSNTPWRLPFKKDQIKEESSKMCLFFYFFGATFEQLSSQKATFALF